MGDRLATVDMDRKLGACAPLGDESPCNTMWSGLRPITLPSSMLIRAAVSPQQTWPKLGLCPFWEGSWICILYNVARAKAIPPCQVSSSSIQPFGHNTPTLQTALAALAMMRYINLRFTLLLGEEAEASPSIANTL